MEPAVTADLVQPPAHVPTAELAAVLNHLKQLARDHELFFRLQVGALVLDTFFGRDPVAYLSCDATKSSKFTVFVQQCRERLDDLGLGDAAARRWVVARIVYDSLPADLAGRLRFSHLVQFAKVEDRATRSLLATASVDNGWSADQLRDAVLAARAGRWIDGQPEVPGIQPPTAAQEPAKTPQLGRVVTKFERMVADVDTLAAEWEQVASKKLTGAHRKRLKEGIADVEVRVEGR